MTIVRTHLGVSALLGVCLFAAIADAKEIYVGPNGNDGNSGESPAQSLRTLAAASGKATAGDTVNVLPGRYNEVLVPERSGTSGSPIVYRGQQGPGRAVISHGSVGGLKSAIRIAGLSHVVIDSIDVDGVTAAPAARVNEFVKILDSKNIIIRRGKFVYANGWSGINIENSSYITIEDNVIDWVGEYRDSEGGGNGDVINARVGSPHHILIQRNSLSHGGHDLLRIDGSFSIIQDNILNNDFRAVEGTDAGYRCASINGSNNVFQRNYLTLSGIGGRGTLAPLQTAAGLRNIFRHNVYTNAYHEGVTTDSGSWAPNAAYARIYHNTFYKLNAPAWRTRVFPDSGSVGYNAFVNNLVVDSRLNPKETSFDADVMFLVSDAGLGPTASGVVRGNVFSPAGGKAPMVLLQGGDGRVSLNQAEEKYPNLLSNNRHATPLFASLAPAVLKDFELRSDSPGVDQGVFLTRVIGSGKSASLRVADSLYFSDGAGLVPGDVIQLESSAEQARIVSIDRAVGVIMLSTALEFKDGQGVALAYAGKAPDAGAREAVAQVAPLPPKGLAVE